MVLSYLADLERRISSVQSAEWVGSALDMLHSIRSDVHSHLPEADTKSELDFSRPLSFAPTLSERLRSLHEHIPYHDLHFAAPTPSFPHSLEAFLPDVDSFIADLPLFPSLSRSIELDEEEAAAARALALSANGARLVNYDALPFAWKNNTFVISGYRFIPLRRWYALVASMFQLHNETPNIQTHFIPLALWGTAFASAVWPTPLAILGRLVSMPALGALGALFAWLFTPLFFIDTWRSPDLTPWYPSPPDFSECLFTVFALGCLASSTLWHTMAGCAHRRTMDFCARVDYVGISWLIAITVVSVIHHGYACGDLPRDGASILHRQVPWLSSPIVAVSSSSGSPMLVAPSLVQLSTSIGQIISYHPFGAACLLCLAAGVSGHILAFCDWFNKVENRLWRVGFFVSLSLSAVAPIAGLVAVQGWEATIRFGAPVMPSLVYYAIGIFIYATQIPERWLGGGKFKEWPWVGRIVDRCGGGSHALWHIFIVLAMRAHRDGLREMRAVAELGGCAIGNFK
ncbi:hemolysin-III related-domain-containing protein [Roridomyces roridus]|uniref:Hemolysin-III related-domain-containing protein n=1 Tax=Roridomyces roridus TaxID=1738132 RepID=A0AAD7BZE6_9AGAR|nr:hemolysin-III related-domain-containing protein [Roridomyces roridus]